jgi:hypothetical protein
MEAHMLLVGTITAELANLQPDNLGAVGGARQGKTQLAECTLMR